MFLKRINSNNKTSKQKLMKTENRLMVSEKNKKKMVVYKRIWIIWKDKGAILIQAVLR